MTHNLTLEITDQLECKVKTVALDIDTIKTARCIKSDAVEIVSKGFPERRLLWLPVDSAKMGQAIVDKIEKALNPVINLDEFRQSKTNGEGTA